MVDVWQFDKPSHEGWTDTMRSVAVTDESSDLDDLIERIEGCDPDEFPEDAAEMGLLLQYLRRMQARET